MPSKPKIINGTADLLQTLRATKRRVFTAHEITQHFYSAREEGLFARHTRASEFLRHLISAQGLTTISLRCRHYSKKETRYCLDQPSPLELAQSLRRNGYLSHASAAFVHGLLTKEPATHFINNEQSSKPVPDRSSLTQASIDRAFAGHPRASNFTFTHRRLRISILNGKHTADYGVEKVTQPNLETLRVTGLERTLVDIAVRPVYCGGAREVLKAYKAAANRVSGETVARTLDALGHIYPYAQVIGFLMQRSGFTEKELVPLRTRASEFDFYLEHRMDGRLYDSEWRVFYPKLLDA